MNDVQKKNLGENNPQQSADYAALRERLAWALCANVVAIGATSWENIDEEHRAFYRSDAEAVLDELGLVRETRIRWEWPEIPEGWRYCDNQTFTDDGVLWRTATNAPKNEAPFKYETTYPEAKRYEDERFVSPWVPLSGASAEQVEPGDKS